MKEINNYYSAAHHSKESGTAAARSVLSTMSVKQPASTSAPATLEVTPPGDAQQMDGTVSCLVYFQLLSDRTTSPSDCPPKPGLI